MSDTCTLPDLKTVCLAMHECIDMSPNISDSSRPYAKYLGDVACANVNSYFKGEPLNIPELRTAIFDWVENSYDLNAEDLSALRSLLKGVETMSNTPPEGLKQIRHTLEKWTQSTIRVENCNRGPFISITRCIYTCVHSFLSGERLNLQPLSILMADILQGDYSVTHAERRRYVAFIDVTCCLIESVVNKPVSLQTVSSKLQESIETHLNLPQSIRYFVRICVDVLCTGVECLFRKPWNLDPLALVLYGWIDKFPNISSKDRANYKSITEESCKKLQSQLNTHFNQLGVLPPATSSNKDPFPVKEKLFSGKADSKFSLTDLRGSHVQVKETWDSCLHSPHRSKSSMIEMDCVLHDIRVFHKHTKLAKLALLLPTDVIRRNGYVFTRVCLLKGVSQSPFHNTSTSTGSMSFLRVGGRYISPSHSSSNGPRNIRRVPPSSPKHPNTPVQDWVGVLPPNQD